MIQFYAPDVITSHALPEEESAHCVRVLRMEVGRRIRVADGKGSIHECEIVEARPKCVKVEIISTATPPRQWPCHITLAVAPTKNFDRMEWLVEKAVELGIDRFVPLVCQHSERRFSKAERLRRIAVSAMNQSLKSMLPQIDDASKFTDFLKETRANTDRFICYCADDVERRLLASTYEAGRDVVILVGPEGDFSPQEVADALAAGFVPVSLGDQRLRTETAALYSVATIHVVNQLGASHGHSEAPKTNDI